MTIALELLILLVLILGNGFLALAEIAVVSAREALLRNRAEEGDSGARLALEMADDPGSFLSSVQIGITLVGILAGVFGGATLARVLSRSLAQEKERERERYREKERQKERHRKRQRRKDTEKDT